jgi:hypothetical protein
MAKRPHNPDHTTNSDQHPADLSNQEISTMPNDTTDNADASTTDKVKVSGLLFAMPAPRYSAGHTLTAGEAAALNQTRVENLRNNTTNKIKVALGVAGVEKAEQLPTEVIAKLEADFHAYAAEYEFTVGSVRRVVDPVETEARKIGRDMLRAALRAKGIDLKTMAEGQFDTLLGGLLDKRPDIRDEAARRVALAKSMAGAIVGDLQSAE